LNFSWGSGLLVNAIFLPMAGLAIGLPNYFFLNEVLAVLIGSILMKSKF
jgi:hypothetical protein